MAKDVKKPNSMWKWVIAVVILLVVIFLIGLPLLTTSGPVLPECLAISGYMCSYQMLHLNTLTFKVGQETGTNWTSVNIIWVPNGTDVPNASDLCNSSSSVASNSITNGITCGFGVSSLASGSPLATVSFNFSSDVNSGQTYGGTIWALYQVKSGGYWYKNQMATASLKAS